MATTAASSFAHPSRRNPRARAFDREQDLYAPVKRFLEDLGYEVKGEVRGCDVVAVRRGGDQGETEPTIVVELKLAFTLGFVLQGVDRLAVTDLVYLAAPTSRPRARSGGSGRQPHSPTHPGVRRLCRRLGLGLLAVHPARKDGAELVEVVCDPCPPAGRRLPRKNKARTILLLGEHARRRGDPKSGRCCRRQAAHDRLSAGGPTLRRALASPGQ